MFFVTVGIVILVVSFVIALSSLLREQRNLDRLEPLEKPKPEPTPQEPQAGVETKPQAGEDALKSLQDLVLQEEKREEDAKQQKKETAPVEEAQKPPVEVSYQRKIEPLAQMQNGTAGDLWDEDFDDDMLFPWEMDEPAPLGKQADSNQTASSQNETRDKLPEEEPQKTPLSGEISLKDLKKGQ